jgi:hypothetical protein
LTPLAALVGGIIYLLDRNEKLRLKAEDAARNDKIKDSINKGLEAKGEADVKTLDYVALRDQYNKEHKS